MGYHLFLRMTPGSTPDVTAQCRGSQSAVTSHRCGLENPFDAEIELAKARAEIERLRALLNDETYIRCKADYSRGHLSHANYLAERERGLL